MSLEKRTVKELREIAKLYHIKGYSKMNKFQLVYAISNPKTTSQDPAPVSEIPATVETIEQPMMKTLDELADFHGLKGYIKFYDGVEKYKSMSETELKAALEEWTGIKIEVLKRIPEFFWCSERWQYKLDCRPTQEQLDEFYGQFSTIDELRQLTPTYARYGNNDLYYMHEKAYNMAMDKLVSKVETQNQTQEDTTMKTLTKDAAMVEVQAAMTREQLTAIFERCTKSVIADVVKELTGELVCEQKIDGVKKDYVVSQAAEKISRKLIAERQQQDKKEFQALSFDKKLEKLMNADENEICDGHFCKWVWLQIWELEEIARLFSIDVHPCKVESDAGLTTYKMELRWELQDNLPKMRKIYKLIREGAKKFCETTEKPETTTGTTEATVSVEPQEKKEAEPVQAVKVPNEDVSAIINEAEQMNELSRLTDELKAMRPKVKAIRHAMKYLDVAVPKFSGLLLIKSDIQSERKRLIKAILELRQKLRSRTSWITSPELKKARNKYLRSVAAIGVNEKKVKKLLDLGEHWLEMKNLRKAWRQSGYSAEAREKYCAYRLQTFRDTLKFTELIRKRTELQNYGHQMKAEYQALKAKAGIF